MFKLFKNKYLLTIATVIIFGLTITLGILYAKDRIERNDLLTEADAVNFAAVDAGFSPEDLRSYEVRLRKADGHYVYRIVLTSDDTRYRYTIAANNGEILSSESALISEDEVNIPSSKFTTVVDNPEKGDTANNQSTSNKPTVSRHYISIDKAKSITLSNAALNPSEVTFEKALLEKDDGKFIYDIEFFTSTKEYEYEIDAYTGDILSKDVDSLSSSDRVDKISKNSSGNPKNADLEDYKNKYEHDDDDDDD